MTACPDCGAQDPADDARFCGRCGALLPSSRSAAPSGRRRAGWRRPIAAGAGVLVLVLVALLVAVGLDRSTPPTWERSARLQLPLAGGVVVAAGPDHVLVGARVVSTTPDGPSARLRGLPPRLASSALDEGRWAVVEGGALVTGSVARGVEDRVRVGSSLAIGGTALAWAQGDPVFLGQDGHAVRLAADGNIAWWSDWPVLAVEVTGERWLLGEGSDGDGIAIAVEDGTVTTLDGQPLTVVGDLAVVRRDELVVGLDLRDGTVQWERSDGSGVWRSVAGGLVLEGPLSVERVDPATGRILDDVAGPAAVAVATGAVVNRDGRLEAVDWDGSVTWSWSLGEGQHRLEVVDAARVAVTSETASGTTAVVLAAADGTRLATRSLLPAPLVAGAAADGVAGLVVPGRARPLVLDVVTGSQLDQRPPSLRRDRLETPDGVQVIADGLVSVRAAGVVGVWRAVLDAPVAVAPVLVLTSVDVATTDGTVRRLAAGDGAVQWEADVDGLPTALGVAGPHLYVGTEDGRIVVLDAAGATIRTIDVGVGVVGLAADDTGLVVVTADGGLRGYAP